LARFRVNKFVGKFLHIFIYFRLLELEDSVKNLELIGSDLTTGNAELQEKVIIVQEQNQELQKRLVEVQEDNKKMEDLAHQLDDANKQIMKLKAQQRTKVKNLTKQLDGLKKVRSDSSFGTDC
jgi:septal ring factor EnvC (AmiA/AmiB activator)